MKSLKYVIVSIALAIGFAAPVVNAQDAAPKAGHPQRGGDMTAPLLKGITLTADQQSKVDTIKADTHKQMQGLSQEDRRAKGREIQQQSAGKIRDVLTPEQQTTFDANRKAMQQRGGDKKGGGKGDKGGKGGGKPAPAPKADGESAD